MTKNQSKLKVIIIGAGIAGLAACRYLATRGIDVSILEARERSGGRICTNNSLGIPLGQGANWIHGIEGNPVAQLAYNVCAKMGTMEPTKFSFIDNRGVQINADQVTLFDAEFQAKLEKAKLIAMSARCDMSLKASLSTLINNNIKPIERTLLDLKYLSLECYLGANPDELSGRHWDQEDAWPGDNCFLISSYKPIIDNLEKDCRIKFNALVKAINMRENKIEVIVGDESDYADYVIITVPLGVLKAGDISFSPPLPSRKHQAIERLKMGLFNITAMKFPYPFWPNQKQAFFCHDTQLPTIPIFLNLHHFIHEPILLGLSGGSRALRLEAMNDRDVVAATMNQFEKIFKVKVPKPTTFFNTRWSIDKYSYGSYSFIPTGATGEDYEALSEPVENRLFFAGEATSRRYAATTHGAYLSGLREAERVVNLHAINKRDKYSE